MFPDPRDSQNDIIAFGSRLDSGTLLEAYRHGIFPWPIEDLPIPWFCPKIRAILEFDRVHRSRSLERAKRQSSWSITIDKAFDSVIRECSEAPRPGQDGTWITPAMVAGYVELHRDGHAHSIEVWDDARLVGGIYGVDPGGCFGGESMFFLEPNASKMALLFLVDHLQERGLEWLDIQVMTPHMETMGAHNIPRGEFLDRLERELASGRTLFD